jgi:L-fucose/D-arabinose isomerase
MPVTMCRINLVKGLGPVLQIAEGWTSTCPKKVHDADERTDPTWPTTLVRAARLTGSGPFRDVYR